MGKTQFPKPVMKRPCLQRRIRFEPGWKTGGRGPTSPYSEKKLRKDNQSGCECLYKNPKPPEKYPKIFRTTQKNNKLLKTQKIPYTEISYVGDRFVLLACQGGRGGSHPCPPSVTPLLAEGFAHRKNILSAFF